MTPEGKAVELALFIANKNAETVPFKLNRAQVELDELVENLKSDERPVRVVIPKPRQKGISSYILGRMLIQCLTRENHHAKIVAHETRATQMLLRKARFLLDNIAGGLSASLKYDTKNELFFESTGSSLSISTAGSPESGRGETIQSLHLSEAAFYPQAKELVAALLQALTPNGELFIESTGNGSHTWYHNRCLLAEQETGKEVLFFIPWHLDDEYSSKLRDDEEDTLMASYPHPEFEEEHLIEDYQLTLEQLKWRRQKIAEFDMDIPLFKQEYPLTLDECFKASSLSYFHKVTYLKSDRWQEVDKDYKVLLGHPAKRMNYSIGVDVAAGVGADSSVIEVLCLETNEQVAEFRSNRIAPDDLAVKIEEIGASFGFPLVVAEVNNHGLTTLDNLHKRGVYPKRQIYWDKQASNNITYSGYKTNKRTKPLLLGRMRRSLAEGLKIYSSNLSGEISTFTDELKAQEGLHDDCVMSFALANFGLDQVGNYHAASVQAAKLSAPSPGAFEGIFKSAQPSGQPISNQAAVNGSTSFWS
jgi:hypothetical protein